MRKKFLQKSIALLGLSVTFSIISSPNAVWGMDEETFETQLYKKYHKAKRAMDDLIKNKKAKRYLKDGRELDETWEREQGFMNNETYVKNPINYELLEEEIWKPGQDKPSTFEEAIRITITTRDTIKNLKNYEEAYRDYVELKDKYSGMHSPRMTQTDLDHADWEVKHGPLPKRFVKEDHVRKMKVTPSETKEVPEDHKRQRTKE